MDPTEEKILNESFNKSEILKQIGRAVNHEKFS